MIKSGLNKALFRVEEVQQKEQEQEEQQAEPSWAQTHSA